MKIKNKLSKLYKHLLSEKYRILIRNIEYRFRHIREISSVKDFKPDFSAISSKKVCFILPSCKLAGGVAVVCEYANRLRDLGFKTIIATVDGTTDLGWFSNQNVQVVSWSKSKTSITSEYDTVIATGWITAYAAASSGIKRAYYLVQSDERRFYPEGSYLRKRVEDTYKLPFRYISIARWMQDWLLSEFGHESSLIRNGLDKEIFNTYGSHIDIRPIDKVRICIEGAIDLKFKKVPQAAEIASQLPKDRYEIWLVSSSGKLDPRWKIDRFFDCVPQKMMGDIYRSCHIMFKLSKSEGMSGPPLESIACGCVPVIAKATGSDEYLEDGVNGYYFDLKKNSFENVLQKAVDLSRSDRFKSVIDRTLSQFDWNKSARYFADRLSQN